MPFQAQTPGVYREDVFPAPEVEHLTGVPAFLGFAGQGDFNVPRPLMLWSQFEDQFGEHPNSYLTSAVRGFFDNGGRLCYGVRLDESLDALKALRQGLEALAALDTIDLVCAPDLMRPTPPDPDAVQVLQAAILEHCDLLNDRFAILDSLPNADAQAVQAQRAGLNSANGALYYPWVWIPDPSNSRRSVSVPPCGHIAGLYAASDQAVGIHKAPANGVLEGVLGLETTLTHAQQGPLNAEHINCLRAFPGRGILVWGARTLSSDPEWTYINVRRLFLEAARWLERALPELTFEANDPWLWTRISRKVTGYCETLFESGILKGVTAQQAFYVKCDSETNPPEARAEGMVIAEIGLAPALPNEFIVIRVIHGAGGVTVSPVV